MASFRDLGFARVDTDREARQGAPEGIMAEGKTPEEIAAIASALLEAGVGQRAGHARGRRGAGRRCWRWRPTRQRTSGRGWRGSRATCPRRTAW